MIKIKTLTAFAFSGLITGFAVNAANAQDTAKSVDPS
jgi:hypothetical protein